MSVKQKREKVAEAKKVLLSWFVCYYPTSLCFVVFALQLLI